MSLHVHTLYRLNSFSLIKSFSDEKLSNWPVMKSPDWFEAAVVSKFLLVRKNLLGAAALA